MQPQPLDITKKIYATCCCGATLQVEAVIAEKADKTFEEWQRRHANCRQSQVGEVLPWLAQADTTAGGER